MSEPDDPLHHASIAVWDLASPVVIGRPTTLKAGVACPAGCDLTGSRIDIYDETGTRLGGGDAGAALWPATSALYWAQLEVKAPETEGEHAWSVHATPPGTAHAHVTSAVRFIASRPPEHRVRLEVLEQGNDAPASIRLGKSSRKLVHLLDDADFELLEALPLWLDLPKNEARLVHGGVVPVWLRTIRSTSATMQPTAS